MTANIKKKYLVKKINEGFAGSSVVKKLPAKCRRHMFNS